VQGRLTEASYEKGSVTINIQVPKPGYYWIWGRVWGLDWSGDSFYVSVNGGPRVTWYISRGSWQWERVTKPWYLTKGPLKTREDGARLDVIEVVNSYAYVPSYVEPCGPTATSSEYTNPLQHSNTDTNSDANEHANTHAHIYADPSL